MRTRSVWLFLAVGLIAAFAYPPLSPTGRWVLNTAVGLACVVALVIGTRRNRPTRATGWYVLAAGLASWVVGDFLWSWNELVAHDSPLASPADPIYLAGYLLVAAGIVQMIRARSPEGDREGFLDAIVAAVAGTILVWELVLDPTIIPTSDPLLIKLLYAAYPLTDVLLLAVLVRLAFVQGARVASFWLLAAGLGLVLVGDIVWSAVAQSGLYSTVLIDEFYLTGYLCLAAAALHPSMRSMAEPGRGRESPFTVGRTAYLALALVLPVAAAMLVSAGLTRQVAVAAPAVAVLIFAVITRVVYATRERERAMEQVRASELRFRTVFDDAAIAIATVDTDGRIIQVNGTAERLFGYEHDALVGAPVATLLDPNDGGFLRQFGEVVRGDLQQYETERRLRRKDGSYIWGQAAISLLRDRAGGTGFAILMVEDITDRKRFQEELADRALHDGLTHLPNRDVFLDRLGVGLARMHRHRGQLAILFLDLDRFKEVNDALGHEAGDRLLIELGTRLTGVVRPTDTVARFGGDEFAVLCEDLPAGGGTGALVERILSVFADPFVIDDHEIFSTASAGVVIAVDPDAAPQDLLRDVDTAMYRAKRRGGARFELFESTMTGEAQERLEIGGRLRAALRDGEFELFYQPIVSMGTGMAVHVEALIRWRHPERGIVPPGEFIPIAVESGLIVPMGSWVLEEAVLQLDRWDRSRPGRQEIGVSVNVSARQFVDADLPSEVERLVHRTGVAPERLCLEITEDALLEDVDQVSKVLRELDGLGVTIAVDDFGTGYSSLGYLRRMPVDFLKVDRSFVSGICEHDGDTELVSAIVAMAHALGLQVVAEGVETAEQLSQLGSLGCDLVQGFLLGRPGPPVDVNPLLEHDLRPVGEPPEHAEPAGRLSAARP